MANRYYRVSDIVESGGYTYRTYSVRSIKIVNTDRPSRAIKLSLKNTSKGIEVVSFERTSLNWCEHLQNPKTFVYKVETKNDGVYYVLVEAC